MEKTTSLILTDGSLESAVVCAIARQKHEAVLFDISDPADEHARSAVLKQTDYLRPRQVVGGHQAIVSDDPHGLFRLNAALAASAPAIRRFDAQNVYLPLRVGMEAEGFGRSAEFVQIAEELLRHGLGLLSVRVEAPLLEMEPWQVVDLGTQLSAPLTSAHGEKEHAAFVRAGRAKP